jgi:hypothetical protein
LSSAIASQPISIRLVLCLLGTTAIEHTIRQRIQSGSLLECSTRKANSARWIMLATSSGVFRTAGIGVSCDRSQSVNQASINSIGYLYRAGIVRRRALAHPNPRCHHYKRTRTTKEFALRRRRYRPIFFDHRDNLREVDLRYASGRQLSEFFQRWLDEYPDPYPQRYRKNVPFAWVNENGILLMKLRNGEVEYPVLQTAGTEEIGTPVDSDD